MEARAARCGGGRWRARGRARDSARDIQAETRPPVTAAAKALELLEHAFLLVFAQPVALIGDGNQRPVADPVEADPYLAVGRRIADRIADEIEQDLQHAPEFGDCQLAFPFGRRDERDALLARAHAHRRDRADLPTCARLAIGLASKLHTYSA